MSGEPQKRRMEHSGAMVAKRQRQEMVPAETPTDLIRAQKERRTSSLKAPIMLLEGHADAVMTLEYDPKGRFLATGSADKNIFLWDGEQELQNTGVLSGHKNVITELHWSADSDFIFSCSADKTIQQFDVERMERVKQLKGHDSFVNSCSVSTEGAPMVASAADDGTVRLWDPRVREPVQTLANRFQMLCVATNADASRIYASGIDNDIKVWDVRSGEQLYKLEAHRDTVTGLALSPTGTHLLSFGMDNAMHLWDVQAFVPGSRLQRSFAGAVHNFEKQLLRCSWSRDGRRVAAGSADRTVCVWDAADAKLLYKLPGHQGTVLQAAFHPTEPVVASASVDKCVYVGEIEAL